MLLTALTLVFLFPAMVTTSDPDLADIVFNASRSERELMLRWFSYQRFNNDEVCANLARNMRNDETTPTLSYSCKHASLMLLAMRADFSVNSEVISTLLDNLTYRDRSISGQTRFLAPHEQYPALMALIRIGSRARDQVFQRIKETDEPKVLSHLAYWFSVQYGKKYSGIIIDDYIKSSKLTSIEMKRLEQVREHCRRSSITLP